MKPTAEAKLIHVKPDSEQDIVRLAQKTLLRADCAGVLPTPIDRLYEQARIETIDMPSPDDMPSFRVTEAACEMLRSGWQKIRGIADLRERAVYLPQGKNDHRHRFVQGHELGHQTIPWHKVGLDQVDTDATLNADVKDKFEAEANLFSSEIIFQGGHFRRLALNYSPTPDAIFTLADQHGASRQATLWRFTEEQDFPVASLFYYPNNYSDGYKLWKMVCSPSFRIKYCDLDIPQFLANKHPWTAAREFRETFDGDISLQKSNGRPAKFLWYSWWNEHALIVLIKSPRGVRSFL